MAIYIYSQRNKKARLFVSDVVLRGTPVKLSEYWTLVRPRRHPRSPRRFLVPSKYLLDRVLCWERNFLQLNKNLWFFCYKNNNYNYNNNSLKLFVCCYCCCCWWLLLNIIFRVWCFKGKITQTGCYYSMLLQLTRKFAFGEQITTYFALLGYLPLVVVVFSLIVICRSKWWYSCYWRWSRKP